MKTDNYLTLCLEQAAKSPLHFRHGAIVVRGGKVIGTGYNCYKPGFDGGALKHGRIANGGLDGETVAALKLKMKALKQKDKYQQDHSQQPAQSGFVPVESTARGGGGGGAGANKPLSMHSEMMAIHSALAASSNLSSTTFSREKPCFKLPRGDKRKSRLRADVLRAYVAQICQTESGSGQLQVKLERDNYNNVREEENVAGSGLGETDSAFHASRGGAKHHWKKNWKGKHQKTSQYEGKYHHQYEYEAKHGGQQQPQPSASRGSRNRDDANVIRRYDATMCDADGHDGDDMTITMTPKISAGTSHGKRSKDYKLVGAQNSPSPLSAAKNATQSGKVRHEPPSPTQHQMLLPVGRAGDAGHSVAERKKHPRLQGADLYVTRRGWSGTAENKEKKKKKVKSAAPFPGSDVPLSRESSADGDLAEIMSSLSSLSLTSADATNSLPCSSSSSTSQVFASLHDEYLANNPGPPPMTSCCDKEIPHGKPPVSASRPCYRCISFMHAVGIRRVFWTNNLGEWEGGKVKDLVDGMNGVPTEVATGGQGGGGLMGNGVFVTKHEVLMMRRIMGAQSAANMK